MDVAEVQFQSLTQLTVHRDEGRRPMTALLWRRVPLLIPWLTAYTDAAYSPGCSMSSLAVAIGKYMCSGSSGKLLKSYFA